MNFETKKLPRPRRNWKEIVGDRKAIYSKGITCMVIEPRKWSLRVISHNLIVLKFGEQSEKKRVEGSKGLQRFHIKCLRFFYFFILTALKAVI